ncbi:ZIP family metal transporter [Bdellovibrio sp. 22V]|uniref:ZIP family metal transporter n=1 Tax=Bdellovibrio TaxID=958 RepID=UPI002543B299|nr:ZIP family metal transporter [Bdellovibrio sp. 22V]WII73643.1 ZIP family metal transporter [Bdellovibrio sp. 22V]
MMSAWMGLLAGGITGLSTMLGALPVLKQETKTWNPWRSLNLDFAIGMMLAAAAFNLIGPAYSSAHGATGVSLALVLGVVSIYGLSHLIHKVSPSDWSLHRRAWLFVTAMMLHNLPEGLASGAALSADSISQANGWTVVGAIVFQNFPEGLATAAAFLSIGLSRKTAFFGACLTGVMEILGGAAGGLFATVTSASLPYILAFAGGAMISVTLEEVFAKLKETQMRYLLQKEFVMGALSVVVMNWIIA